MSLVRKSEFPPVRRKQISNRKKIPPFYHIRDHVFYHGPAWIIKPRLFERKKNYTEKPGPNHYYIPDRSVYARPGKTIGSRDETTPFSSTLLLAHYYPNDHYTSNIEIPAISIAPRRTERKHRYDHSGRFYLPSNLMQHRPAPLLRPLYGRIISRKSSDKRFLSSSPGPAAYPIYEFDEDILPRPQPGCTQKHRSSSDKKIDTLRTNPPFYYPNIALQHRPPSFTIGKRLSTSEKVQRSVAPYYTPFDGKTLCSNIVHPGATLKGRWSPAVYTVLDYIPKIKTVA